MIPLSHKDRSSFGYRVREKLNSWKRLIFSDRNSRNLFLFLLLNLSFAFVELFYGIATNSLGGCLGTNCFLSYPLFITPVDD